MKENKLPLVSIHCTVFNHESYLSQCLEGFVAQKTNFVFEAIIHDDVSTDGSVAIIRKYAEKYPSIIKPIYETENQYSKNDGSLERIMDQAIHPHVKYIAICEGDDYWTDPYKLQKEVDFLERNNDYGLVYGKAKVFNQRTQKFIGTSGKETSGKEELIFTNVIPTLTVLMRKELYLKFNQEIHPYEYGWGMSDFPMWIWFSIHSKVKFLDEELGVYRVLPESASHFTDLNKTLAMSLSSLSIKKYFINRYWLEEEKQQMLDTAERYFYLRGRILVAKVGGEKLNKECTKFFLSQKMYFSAWVTKLLYFFKSNALIMRIIIKLESLFIDSDYKY